MASPMSELAGVLDELGLDDAARAARSMIEAALEHLTPIQRDQFWNAIGLYYSTRRHPGAAESATSADASAA